MNKALLGDVMANFILTIQNNWFLLKLVYSVVTLVIIYVLILLLKNLVYKYVENKDRYYQIKKGLNYFQGFLIFLALLIIWLEVSANLTTYIGLLSAGIAVALKEVIADMAGWVFISSRHSFVVGDRIEINGIKGDVIDIRLFQFTVIEIGGWVDAEQSTGRLIDIPNSYVFVYPTTNYNKGFNYIWNEIKVLITFESDWELAKKLLKKVVIKDQNEIVADALKEIKQAARKYMIHYQNLGPIVYTDVKESGVELTLRYLCSPKKRRTSVTLIWEDILTEFAKYDQINLAYPTYTYVKK